MDVDPYKTSSVEECRLIELPRHHHANGNLSVVEDDDPIPFKIQRTYFTYDIPAGVERGGHSHRELYQLIVAVSGSFDVIIDDGCRHRCVTLNRPYQGLIVTPGIWRVLNNFTSGAVCMVLASQHYDEDDYTRDYNDFLALTRNKQQP